MNGLLERKLRHRRQRDKTTRRSFVPLGNLSKPAIAAATAGGEGRSPPRVPEGTPLMVGLDVGSTTVKAVVVNPADDKILWQDYQRHDTKQPEKVLEFLKRMEEEVGIVAGHSRIFITGSGGGGMAPLIGAKFVQEVNAVALAVEKLYPECGSVIELGGQDAKIIIFKEDPNHRAQEENSFDERQVRRRHRRGDRQDQRQAAHSRRTALRDGLRRT